MTRPVHSWRRLGNHPQRTRGLSCQAMEAALQPKNDDSVHSLERNWTRLLASKGGFEVGHSGGNGECEKAWPMWVAKDGRGRWDSDTAKGCSDAANATLRRHTHEERQKSTLSRFWRSWVPTSQSVHVSFVGSDSTAPK